MKFLIDNALSPALAEGLQAVGYDAVHVRDYGLDGARDEDILDRAADEDRIVVSVDTDFGTLLLLRQAQKPSFILFRGDKMRRPETQISLLTNNLPNLQEVLEQGSIVVFRQTGIRVRRLPIWRGTDPEPE